MSPKPDIDKVKACLTSYFIAWKKGQWFKMHKHTTQTWAHRYDEANLRIRFPYRIGSYRTLEIARVNDVVYDARIQTTYMEEEVVLFVRMVKESAPYVPSPVGEFGVNPVSIRKIV